jgi:hypothetical protein
MLDTRDYIHDRISMQSRIVRQHDGVVIHDVDCGDAPPGLHLVEPAPLFEKRAVEANRKTSTPRWAFSFYIMHHSQSTTETCHVAVLINHLMLLLRTTPSLFV